MKRTFEENIQLIKGSYEKQGFNVSVEGEGPRREINFGKCSGILMEENPFESLMKTLGRSSRGFSVEDYVSPLEYSENYNNQEEKISYDKKLQEAANCLNDLAKCYHIACQLDEQYG